MKSFWKWKLQLGESWRQKYQHSALIALWELVSIQLKWSGREWCIKEKRNIEKERRLFSSLSALGQPGNWELHQPGQKFWMNQTLESPKKKESKKHFISIVLSTRRVFKVTYSKSDTAVTDHFKEMCARNVAKTCNSIEIFYHSNFIINSLIFLSKSWLLKCLLQSSQTIFPTAYPMVFCFFVQSKSNVVCMHICYWTVSHVMTSCHKVFFFYIWHISPQG